MADAETKVVANSSQLRVDSVTAQGGEALAWQRCIVADRVLVVLEGRGYCYGTYGREESREEVNSGDVLHIPSMVWHRLAAAGEGRFSAVVVTHQPSDVELRT